MKKILSIVLVGILVLSGLGAGASYVQKSSMKQSVIFDEYDMVIIAPNKFSVNIQPLIDHKNSVGIQTFLKTTEDIYDEYQGRDQAEQIKYFIYDSVKNLGIKYVLLIGDIDLLPIRTSYVKYGPIEDVISDLYYSDVFDLNGSFCSWDSNENDLFGECNYIGNHGYEIDNVDLYPDVGVGRIPCSYIDELENVIIKIITYETETYGCSWFKKIILMGGDTFPQFTQVVEGEWELDKYGEIMQKHGFEQIKLYTSTRTFKPSIVNREITDGAGFVSFSGHGKPFGIGTSSPNKYRSINYLTPYILGMKNDDRLPIFFLEACETAGLDYKILSIMKFPCLAWSLVKKQSGGGIAAVGATRSGPMYFNPNNNGEPYAGGYALHMFFYEAYEPGIALSDLMINACCSYLDNYWKDPIILENIILIGDPSLKIGGYQN
jgi:hypothetical protein